MTLLVAVSVTAFAFGLALGLVQRERKDRAAFWEAKAHEHHKGWLEADKRAAQFERELQAIRGPAQTQPSAGHGEG